MIDHPPAMPARSAIALIARTETTDPILAPRSEPAMLAVHPDDPADERGSDQRDACKAPRSKLARLLDRR
jgi:hypothetical protein